MPNPLAHQAYFYNVSILESFSKTGLEYSTDNTIQIYKFC